MKSVLPLLALLLASPALAQEQVPESVFFIGGKCETLSVGPEDLGALCAGEILQIFYTDGRTELFVALDDKDGRFVVFAGPRQLSAETGEVVQEVDTVIASPDYSGDDSVTKAATGQCRHPDPLNGPVRFSCQITDESGLSYAFAFLTDGEMPENMLD